MAITKNDIRSEITLKKVEVNIDLSKELKGLSSSVKSKISADVADLIRREVGNDAINKQLSSVSGKKFKGLSKDYKELKKKEGKGTRANLLLDGDMFGNFRKSSAVQSVKLIITKSKEITKSFRQIKQNYLEEQSEEVGNEK